MNERKELNEAFNLLGQVTDRFDDSSQEGKPEVDELIKKLKDSAAKFNSAWGTQIDNDGVRKHPLGMEPFTDQESTPKLSTVVAHWFNHFLPEHQQQGEEDQNQPTKFTRGDQVVLDLALKEIFPLTDDSVSSQNLEAAGTTPPSIVWLKKHFQPRVQSIRYFNKFLRIENFNTDPFDYCKSQSRSVCTPILLSLGEEGAIRWLTVDLFEDGLGTFAPDFLSLDDSLVSGDAVTNESNKGASEEKQDDIGTPSSPDDTLFSGENVTDELNEDDLEEKQGDIGTLSSPDDTLFSGENVTDELNEDDPEEKQGDVGILQSFDLLWKRTKLGELGFSGRWRITKQPTTRCDAAHIESDRLDRREFISYSGRSAEMAMLGCLLAASGYAYEPIPLERPPKYPDRVFLNPIYAVTATVLPAASEEKEVERDIRNCRLGRVWQVDRKLAACNSYKLQGNDAEPTLIDTVIISKGDEKVEKENQDSQYQQAKLREENQRKDPKNITIRGIHFQACATVEKTLFWMLSVNIAKMKLNEKKRIAWEEQWDVVRNENGKPIVRDENEESGLRVVDEKDGISTGSLDYMRNPFGGATLPQPEPSSEEPSEGSSDPDDVGPVQ